MHQWCPYPACFLAIRKTKATPISSPRLWFSSTLSNVIRRYLHRVAPPTAGQLGRQSITGRPLMRGRKLAVVQLCIKAAFCQQLVVGAALYNAARVHH